MNDNHQTSDINLNDCWLWARHKDYKGYGRIDFTLNGIRQTQAHRVIYEAYRGEIPGGLVLDHLCRVRCCVNPEHLEPVSNRENVLRGIGFPAKNVKKTHCPSGHKYTPENIRIRVSSQGTRRRCRTCDRAYTRSWRERNR